MRYKTPTARDLLLTAVAAIGLFGGSAVFYQSSRAAGAPAPAAPPAVPVAVETLQPHDVRLWSSFSGRTRPVDYAEIRPEVNGRIVEVRFNDGQMVKAGDVLFVIDPRPFEAEMAKAEANVATAKAASQLAKMELDRAKTLTKTGDIAQSTFDARFNASSAAEAAIQSAEAELKQARVDLDHAYVKAPFTGRVSRPEVTVGNLVSTNVTPPLLTSIVSRDGIYVDFEVDEQTYLSSIRANADTLDKEHSIPVEVSAKDDNAGHVYRGTIESFDNRIDTASGTIRARAKFTNDDGALVPGMFVAVKLGGARNVQALLVPERAVSTDQSKKFVYVVGDDSKVAYRETVLGQQVGDSRVVLSGLNPGDRVIVDGVQHVRPNMAVQPNEIAERREASLLVN